LTAALVGAVAAPAAAEDAKPSKSSVHAAALAKQLAQAKLGMADNSSVQLSSFDQLPRRGAEPAPLNNSPVRNASAQLPAPAARASESVSTDPNM